MIITPLLKINNIYLKREDQNPTGSAKDRALSVQIRKLEEKGIKDAVISSTGNAAISAQYYCKQAKIKLTIFVSPQINKEKCRLLSGSTLIFDPNPIKAAFQFAKKNNLPYLRQSTDPNAILGYQQIGRELLDQLPTLSSIFIPTASGSTLLGISQTLPSTVKIFAIQPANYHPIASYFDQNFTTEPDSITDALSVKLLPLKHQVIAAINHSHGSALIVQNQDIITAQEFLQNHQIITSNEGALALAGYNKANLLQYDIGNSPVILLTGAKR